MKWSVASLRFSVQVSSACREDSCNVDPVILSAEVHGGKTVLGLGIGIGSVLQQEVSHVNMTLLRCQMQGSESGLNK